MEERSVPALGRARRRSNGRACRTRSNKGCEPPGADPGGQAKAMARAGLGWGPSQCAHASWAGPRGTDGRAPKRRALSTSTIARRGEGESRRRAWKTGQCTLDEVVEAALARASQPAPIRPAAERRSRPPLLSPWPGLRCAALRCSALLCPPLLSCTAHPPLRACAVLGAPPSPCLDNAVTVTVAVASRASMLRWCGVEGKSEEAAPSMDADREGGVTSDAALRHGLAVSEQGRPAVHVELLLSASCCGHHINNPPAALAF